ncbi:hypothetical protein [Mycobacterium servetii]|uniref:Uncharacterized protein n=1 Tax=Mycobacterium servetii TaxID=3237418 RepID=A0ABV4CA51_9MYCO
MHARVVEQAAQLRLRGARQWVLTAVLWLLCERWTKIADDQLRLSQIVDEISRRGGRRYDLKTVGRALAALAGHELISYQPAQGRGGFAVVAIHGQFVRDIAVLQRDKSGRVITQSVTFSDGVPISSPKGIPHYSPSPRSSTQPHTTRPVEVDVRPGELSYILRSLPAPLDELPRHLRWLLGREIRIKLSRGFLPEQILHILGKQLPAGLGAPYKLAMWRLRNNMRDVGPRLKPLQAQWDREDAARARRAAKQATTCWYSDVAAVTTPDQRRTILQAHEVKFGAGIPDPIAALANAGARAQRLHPEMSLAAALHRWVHDTLSQGEQDADSATTAGGTDLLLDLAVNGCIQCHDPHAPLRTEMPLPAPVCDRCWPAMAADFTAGPADDELARECA